MLLQLDVSSQVRIALLPVAHGIPEFLASSVIKYVSKHTFASHALHDPTQSTS